MTAATAELGAAELGAARTDRIRDVLVVAGPAALAAVLCLIDLTGRSLGFDEAASVTIASQQGHALGAAIAHDGGNMSGYYVLLRLLTALFGTGTFIIRLPSVLAIAATAGLTSLLGLRLFGRQAAIVAGLLTAVSLPLVFWGQDVRGYAPMVALVTASFVAFVSVVDTDPKAPLNRRALAGYFLAITASAYFSFVAVLVIPAQLIALIWRRHALRRIGYTLAVSVIFWIPLMVLAKRRGSGQLFWVPHPSFTVFKQVFEALTSAGLQPSFGASARTYVLVGITLALLIAVALWHVRDARRATGEARRPQLWGQALVLLWFAVPVVVSLVESILAAPIFTPRNLLTCVPAASLALAFAFADRRLPRALAFGALAAVVVLRALALAPSYGASPEDWKYATKTVLADSQPGDCIAFYPLDGRMAFSYYVRERDAEATAPRLVAPTAPWSQVIPYVERYESLSPARVRRIAASCPRLWFVSSHEGQKTGPVGSRRNFNRYRRLRARLRRSYVHHHKMRFGYAATIHVLLLSGGRGRSAKAAAISRRTSAS
jgi:mannosyltransferase